MRAIVLKTFIGIMFLLICATGANGQVGWFLLGVAAGQSGTQQEKPSSIVTKNVGDLKMTIFYQRPDIADKIPLRHRGSIRVISKKIESRGRTLQELFEDASTEDLDQYPWHRKILNVGDCVLLGAGATPDPEGTIKSTYTFWYIEKDKLLKK